MDRDLVFGRHARSGVYCLTPGERHSQDPLRITLVSCSYDPALAGPEDLLERYHSTEAWARAIARPDTRVTVVHRFSRDATLRRGDVDYRFVADGTPPTPPSWFWGSRVTRAVVQSRPALVHLDGLIFPMLARHLRMALPRAVALLVQDHGGGSHQGAPALRSPARRAFYRWGLASADAFIFTAAAQAEPWRRAGVIAPRQPVHAIPESSTELASRARRTSSSARLPGAPALLWVGRLDANKDPITVLDGFERALGDLPGAALTMVFGEDGLLPEVRARVAGSPALRERVHLRGRLERNALPEIYAGADLFVLGSHHEGSGYALIEAIAFGVTPVVTDIPSFRALTGDGRIGAQFRPGDAAGLAGALVRVAKGDLAARRADVQRFFAQELSWDAVRTRAIEVYAATAHARAAATSPRAGRS